MRVTPNTPYPRLITLFQMDEKSLATPATEGVNTGDSLSAEAMVRGVLRVLEHLGYAEPASRQPMEIEELVESGSSLMLPRLSAATLPALVLRRPREVDAVCAGSASATAPAGTTVNEAEGPEKVDPKPPTMAGHWAPVERLLKSSRTRPWPRGMDTLRSITAAEKLRVSGGPKCRVSRRSVHSSPGPNGSRKCGARLKRQPRAWSRKAAPPLKRPGWLNDARRR